MSSSLCAPHGPPALDFGFPRASLEFPKEEGSSLADAFASLLRSDGRSAKASSLPRVGDWRSSEEEGSSVPLPRQEAAPEGLASATDSRQRLSLLGPRRLLRLFVRREYAGGAPCLEEQVALRRAWESLLRTAIHCRKAEAERETLKGASSTRVRDDDLGGACLLLFSEWRQALLVRRRLAEEARLRSLVADFSPVLKKAIEEGQKSREKRLSGDGLRDDAPQTSLGGSRREAALLLILLLAGRTPFHSRHSEAAPEPFASRWGVQTADGKSTLSSATASSFYEALAEPSQNAGFQSEFRHPSLRDALSGEDLWRDAESSWHFPRLEFLRSAAPPFSLAIQKIDKEDRPRPRRQNLEPPLIEALSLSLPPLAKVAIQDSSNLASAAAAKSTATGFLQDGDAEESSFLESFTASLRRQKSSLLWEATLSGREEGRDDALETDAGESEVAAVEQRVFAERGESAALVRVAEGSAAVGFESQSLPTEGRETTQRQRRASVFGEEAFADSHGWRRDCRDKRKGNVFADLEGEEAVHSVRRFFSADASSLAAMKDWPSQSHAFAANIAKAWVEGSTASWTEKLRRHRQKRLQQRQRLGGFSRGDPHSAFESFPSPFQMDLSKGACASQCLHACQLALVGFSSSLFPAVPLCRSAFNSAETEAFAVQVKHGAVAFPSGCFSDSFSRREDACCSCCPARKLPAFAASVLQCALAKDEGDSASSCLADRSGQSVGEALKTVARFGSLVRRLRSFGEEMTTSPSEQLLRVSRRTYTGEAREAPLLYGLSLAALGRFVLAFLSRLEQTLTQRLQAKVEDGEARTLIFLLKEVASWEAPLQALASACVLHFEEEGSSLQEGCMCRLPSEKATRQSRSRGCWVFPRGVSLVERLFALAARASPGEAGGWGHEGLREESLPLSEGSLLQAAFTEAVAPFLETLTSFASRAVLEDPTEEFSFKGRLQLPFFLSHLRAVSDASFSLMHELRRMQPDAALGAALLKSRLPSQVLSTKTSDPPKFTSDSTDPLLGSQLQLAAQDNAWICQPRGESFLGEMSDRRLLPFHSKKPKPSHGDREQGEHAVAECLGLPLAFTRQDLGVCTARIAKLAEEALRKGAVAFSQGDTDVQSVDALAQEQQKRKSNEELLLLSEGAAKCKGTPREPLSSRVGKIEKCDASEGVFEICNKELVFSENKVAPLHAALDVCVVKPLLMQWRLTNQLFLRVFSSSGRLLAFARQVRQLFEEGSLWSLPRVERASREILQRAFRDPSGGDRRSAGVREDFSDKLPSAEIVLAQLNAGLEADTTRRSFELRVAVDWKGENAATPRTSLPPLGTHVDVLQQLQFSVHSREDLSMFLDRVSQASAPPAPVSSPPAARVGGRSEQRALFASQGQGRLHGDVLRHLLLLRLSLKCLDDIWRMHAKTARGVAGPQMQCSDRRCFSNRFRPGALTPRGSKDCNCAMAREEQLIARLSLLHQKMKHFFQSILHFVLADTIGVQWRKFEAMVDSAAGASFAPSDLRNLSKEGPQRRGGLCFFSLVEEHRRCVEAIHARCFLSPQLKPLERHVLEAARCVGRLHALTKTHFEAVRKAPLGKKYSDVERGVQTARGDSSQAAIAARAGVAASAALEKLREIEEEFSRRSYTLVRTLVRLGPLQLFSPLLLLLDFECRWEF